MGKFHQITKKSFSIIHNAIQNSDVESLAHELSNYHHADIADLYEDLSPKSRMKLLELYPQIIDANVLKLLEEFYKAEVIAQLGVDHFKQSLDHWTDEELIELIDLLDPRDQARLISVLGENHRLAIDTFIKYDNDSVGHNMSLDFVLIPVTWTVEKAIAYIKTQSKLSDDCVEIFVVNNSFNPIGIVSISTLISSQKEESIGKIANFDIISINASSDKEKAYALFSKYRFPCIPVVENSGRMVGVLRTSGILKIVEEEVAEDCLNLGGAADHNTSNSIVSSSIIRLRWLSISFLNALFSPIIIQMFQDTIEKTIALATLMPIVSSIGGSIGMQAVSVVVKAFSAQQLRERQFLNVVLREAIIGSINGLIIGILLGVMATLCFSCKKLGLILGISMFFCASWAAFIGALLPILFDKLGYDATLSSGPLVTAVTDVSGFLVFLGIAHYMLG